MLIPFLYSSIRIQLLDGADPDQIVGEIIGVNVVLGSHPSNVHQIGVLTGVNPDSVEVLIYQLQSLGIQWWRFT